MTAHISLWRGDVHFCNGKLHLVCFAMLKYMKTAVKRTRLEPDLALKRLCNGCWMCGMILYMTFTFAFNHIIKGTGGLLYAGCYVGCGAQYRQEHSGIIPTQEKAASYEWGAAFPLPGHKKDRPANRTASLCLVSSNTPPIRQHRRVKGHSGRRWLRRSGTYQRSYSRTDFHSSTAAFGICEAHIPTCAMRAEAAAPF